MSESSESSRYRFGIIGADRILVETVQAAMAGLAQLAPIEGSHVEIPGFLILAVHAPLGDEINRLASFRRRFPDTPIIIIASGLEANVAVEMVKCGAADYLELPYNFDSLRRKAERVLFGSTAPTIDAELVYALMQGLDATPPENRRVAFRARVVDTIQAFAKISDELRIEVEDISLPTEKKLGGMSWRASSAAANQLPLAQWTRGTVVPFTLELENGKRRYRARAHIVRVMLPPPGRVLHSVRLGVQYSLENPQDEKDLQRFWAECQRRLAGPVRQ